MSNIREVGVTINIQKTSVVEEIAVKEELAYIDHKISEKMIYVGTNFYNSKGNILKSEVVSIIGEHYNLLMSDDKTIFGDDKTQGVFQEKDVWVLVDKIRKG